MCFKKYHNFISDSKQKDLNFKLFQFNSYNLQSAFLFGLIKFIDKKRVQKIVTPKENLQEYYLPVENGKHEKVCKDFFNKYFFYLMVELSRLVKSKMVSDTPPLNRIGKHTPFNKNKIIYK